MEPFDAIIDEEMEPGDILYIPPGFPHEGYALENALNYSVGFRAPNGRELVRRLRRLRAGARAGQQALRRSGR